ncbi:TetR/AcrR family transcriptional regulator [Rugosimonospora africana]|uniref:TetR family transcriptional regulator n=1 Tax=Rugosimonospora africana TaxID=556532 RepID=A0A8J3QNT5_9ACTN|nr:TetR/AcrR family transcriptional regulator [Rugosimonospora africana]GIH13549.1 TetR family transcriptional regulator [Rugosimonospora africana]
MTIVDREYDDRATGLRERKKIATREALSSAALRLALERGPENVRVDDIAAEAGVSARTYNNYFSSREEAICVALTADRALRIGAALRAQPADKPLAEAIVDAMVSQYCLGEPDQKTLCLLFSTPALRNEYFRTTTAMEWPLAQAIAARTGLDATRDLFPRALAGALSGAARVAAEHWLAAGASDAEERGDAVKRPLSHSPAGASDAEERGDAVKRPLSHSPAGDGTHLADVLREALSWVATALQAPSPLSTMGEPEC